MTESQKAAEHYRKEKCGFVFSLQSSTLGFLPDRFFSCLFFFFLKWKAFLADVRKKKKKPRLPFPVSWLCVSTPEVSFREGQVPGTPWFRDTSWCIGAWSALQGTSTRVGQLLSSLLVHSLAVLLFAELHAVPHFVGEMQGYIWAFLFPSMDFLPQLACIPLFSVPCAVLPLGSGTLLSARMPIPLFLFEMQSLQVLVECYQETVECAEEQLPPPSFDFQAISFHPNRHQANYATFYRGEALTEEVNCPKTELNDCQVRISTRLLWMPSFSFFFYVALFPDLHNCKESLFPLSSYAFGSPNGRTWNFPPLMEL